MAIDLFLYGLGELAGVACREGRIAERRDHSLAWLAFRIAISLNELQQRSALDLFGAEKHARKMAEKVGI